MSTSTGPETLLLGRHDRRSSGDESTGTRSRELPPDLIREAVRRLRIVALVFAGTFFMANFFPALLSKTRAQFFSDFHDWGPGTISIAIGLGVFALASNRRIAPAKLLGIGLVFQVLGSFGIAASQYWGLLAMAQPISNPEYIGLSWVAPWVLLYTVLVPSRPGRALLATIASTSSVPIVFAILGAHYGGSLETLTWFEFFFGLVFPNVLVTAMAYVGARVVYRMGTAITRARELGSYQLTDRLGRGGMGEVWRARHRMLARPAAIKLIRPDVLGEPGSESREVAVKRFEREAQATAALRSPHTIELYDFGIGDDGSFYYVMELLDGLDLDSLIREHGPVPAARAIHLLRQVCDSLAEAHETGLIHRDIKPANIFVCRHGRELDFIKVLDFGLVKQSQEDRSDDIVLTREHAAGGTPAYMAPEQVLGDRPIDPRTDLYALGCVGYWLLTGRAVFEGETSMKTMMRHVQDRPVPPSQRTELDIPARLDRLILSCLDKDPSGRPAGAEMLARELATCATDHPWTRDDARRWWERHRPPAGPDRIAVRGGDV